MPIFVVHHDGTVKLLASWGSSYDGNNNSLNRGACYKLI